jgi:glycosyltransferase involved in cell wall biosynthesis
MRIGIDARELCGRPTGVGRYLGGLLREWASSNSRAHDFVLYGPGPIGLSLDARRFPTRLVPGRGGTWWEQIQLPRALRADHLDVWFAPAYTAPLRIVLPLVLTIHDVSFVAHPEWFRMREGARRRWLVRQAAQKAAAVMTVSQFSRQELIDRLEIPAAKIHVTPNGVSTSNLGTTGLRALNQSISPRVAGAPRLLYVGSIFNRRHVTDLIRGFAPLARARPDVSLDIVGDNRSYPHENLRATIAAEGVGDQVRWHEYVSDEQLRDLYAGARAFAFLSEYEGFGLTPLEALARAIPPVLLDTPAARETCGAAALYVAAGSIGAITSAIESVLFDEAERRRIFDAAPAQLAKFSWARCAADTLAVIETVARA